MPENYKPYPFLYKNKPTTGKITVEFYVNLPTNKVLGTPNITFSAATNTTTLTYSVDSGTSRSPVKYDEEIAWNGNPANVVIVVGTGSGGTGGTAAVTDSMFD